MTIIKNLLNRWADYRRDLRTIAELHSLSDRELQDVGIYRCDIARTVFDKG